MSLDLEALGISQEDLQSRVIERICDRLLTTGFVNEDGDPIERESEFRNKLNEAIREKINAAVRDLADKHVLPNAGKYVENICLTETTRWGEKTGKTKTFIEYLVERAEAYLTEQVNYEGKSKSEERYGSWSGTQTRISHMVHSHLHYRIESAMKEALAKANSAIVQGIEATVKIKLEEVSKALALSVKTK